MSEKKDKFLSALGTAAKKIGAQIKDSPEYALIAIGVKSNAPKPSENATLQTFFAGVGDVELIAEGLYSELMHQLSDGDPTLFYIIRDVVLDIGDELGIDVDSYPIDPNDGNQTLH